MFEKLTSIFLGLLSFMPGMQAQGPLALGQRVPNHLRVLTSQGKSEPFPVHGIVVVYFFPVAGTSHCTQQACSLRDSFSEFKGLAQIVGVSYDSPSELEKFKKNNRLPFNFWSDSSRELARLFGANRTWILDWAPKRMTLIFKNGVLAKQLFDVDVRTHKNQVLNDLRALIEP